MSVCRSINELSNFVSPYPSLEPVGDTDSIDFIKRIDRLVNPVNSAQRPGPTQMRQKRMFGELRTDIRGGMNWMFRTYDLPQNISRFYRNRLNRQGWFVTRQSDMDMVLRAGNTTLKIYFPSDRSSTLLVYCLQR